MLATVISNDRVSRPKADLHYRGSSGHPVNWIHAYMSALLRILFGTNLLGFYDTPYESGEFSGLCGSHR